MWLVMQRKEQACSEIIVVFMINVWHFRDVALFFFAGKCCHVVLVAHKHSRAVVMSYFFAVSVGVLRSLQ